MTRRRNDLRLPVRLTFLALGLCVLLTLPVAYFGGKAAVNHMLLGAGASWLTILVSYLVLMFVVRDVRRFHVAVAIGGFALRLIFLWILFSWLARSFGVNLTQIIIWLVAFYLVFVIYEGLELAAEARKTRTEV